MALEPLTADGAAAEPAVPGAGRAGRSPAEILAAATGRFGRLDLRNTWQVAAGSVLVPLGVVVILISWYGAAHASVVQQQIPYLVSGSFVGLGMMIVGGLLYWAHWLYRIYDQADLHHTERMARDQQLVDLMEAALAGPRAGGLPAGPRTPVAAAGAAVPTAGAERAGLVATASGTNVHRADCPVALRHPNGLQRLTPEQAAERTACRICQPFAD